MSTREFDTYYFLGIGGIGMSALARWLRSRGKEVMGYDRTPSPLTTELEWEGISINYHDTEFEIPTSLTLPDAPERALIVFTPAIPPDSRQMAFFHSRGFKMMKRAEMLGEITRDMHTLAVAGTHGKTTTSAMLAHILHASGHGCNAFLGGIAANYDSNVILNAASNTAVVEADEFDRSFLRLSPDIAIVNNTDPDHLDIYHRHEDVRAAFEEFTQKIKPGGLLIARHDLELQSPRTLTFGLEQGDIRATHIRTDRGSYLFDIEKNGQHLGAFSLSMPGRHNLLNATAAIAAALESGVAPEKISCALAEFKGVKRRWEIVFSSENLVFVDDYAHHPEEIAAAIRAAREFYPDWPVTVFFQPHLYSRTRDFAEGFSRSLSAADRCFLLPIYPARELPIEGVTSDMLMSGMPDGKANPAHPQEVAQMAANVERGVIMTLGAGDIDRLVEPIARALESKHPRTNEKA